MHACKYIHICIVIYVILCAYAWVFKWNIPSFTEILFMRSSGLYINSAINNLLLLGVLITVHLGFS